jgi:hypothetical protein
MFAFLLTWFKDFMSRKPKKNEVENLKKLIMTTQKQLLQAIEKNGLAIAGVHDAVNSVAPQILKALEDAKNGAASTQQIEEAIALLNNNTEQVAKAKDAVLQLVPTVPSPEQPTEPTPTPAPVDTVPAPDSIDEIEINPTPDTIGLPGTVSIDVV